MTVHRMYRGGVAKPETNFERSGSIVDDVLRQHRGDLGPSEMLQIALIDAMRAITDELSLMRVEMRELRETAAAVPALTEQVEQLREQLRLAA